MAKFEITTPQGRFEVQAPSLDAAVAALRGGNQTAPSTTPPMQLQGKITPSSSGAVEPSSNIEDRRPLSPFASVQNFARGAVEGVPILGPTLHGLSRDAEALIAGGLTGRSFEDARNLGERRDENMRERAPLPRIAGNVVGAVGSMIPLGATALGARALGLTGGLGARTAASAGSGAVIGGLDAAARGRDPVADAGLGFGIGLVLPSVGAGIRAGVSAVGNKVQPALGALLNSDGEAARRLGRAYQLDQSLTPTALPSAADEAVAASSGLRLMNADRGGETVRALSRSVTNQSPGARQVIEDATSQRFGTQAERARNVVTDLAGGNVDDIAFRESLEATARATNKPAYDAVRNIELDFAALGQQGLDRLKGVFTTPMGRSAISEAANMMRNDQAWTGKLTVGFLDYAKRALDDVVQANTAIGGKVNNVGRQARDMARAITEVADAAAPGYAQARAGAARFFGEDSAVKAGQKFARSPRSVPEARKAFGQMNGAERQAFQTGYASELIDKIQASGDRFNVIQSVFGSPAARELNEMVFGVAGSRQLEAWVRVEAIADKLRQAMGNSTTARQLQELGLATGQIGGAGAIGYFGSGGNLTAGLATAAAAAGGRHLNQKVLHRMAEMLTSNDPAIIQQAIANAAKSPAHMDALEAFAKVLSPASRGGVAAGQQQLVPAA